MWRCAGVECDTHVREDAPRLVRALREARVDTSGFGRQHPAAATLPATRVCQSVPRGKKWATCWRARGVKQPQHSGIARSFCCSRCTGCALERCGGCVSMTSTGCRSACSLFVPRVARGNGCPSIPNSATPSSVLCARAGRGARAEKSSSRCGPAPPSPLSAGGLYGVVHRHLTNVASAWEGVRTARLAPCVCAAFARKRTVPQRSGRSLGTSQSRRHALLRQGQSGFAATRGLRRFGRSGMNLSTAIDSYTTPIAASRQEALSKVLPLSPYGQAEKRGILHVYLETHRAVGRGRKPALRAKPQRRLNVIPAEDYRAVRQRLESRGQPTRSASNRRPPCGRSSAGSCPRQRVAL